ncbi:hypothetical protein [Legionella longbeachae]|uniref:Uncharacterized protein n=1 Tax=Legionella longbeachae serogroup 1 (strain NSW150) TaxID=661367 RepID=D3HSW2_LEGLN|nr:hypothetical protein [Legionella longbeachae]VEE02493.1 Uncharacterised protein [Legionella oakridgensis]ARB91234.1 hypothetical protein A6J40_03090 [Legionella longbeachae]EEZ93441.1 hypothetical protein LLB_3836 [Legionella longbeachae D-4968]QIN32343.1 hypothetical protein GCB94_09380 [Legionella longbeachae]QIN35689.1 hypothetical protein GCS73_08620 [Legionella longbeachae]
MYWITTNENYFNQQKVEALSEKELKELIKIRRLINSNRSFLFNMDYLIQNYVDFELELYKASLLYQTYPYDRAVIEENIRKINLKLINLFSTSKAFIDKGHSLIKRIINNDYFTKRTHFYYDKFFSYRLIEALRNSTQHSDDPLDILKFNSASISGNSITTVMPFVDTERLRLNKKFKISILPPDSIHINLTLCVRQYVECLSKVYNESIKEVQPIIKHQIENAKEILLKKNLNTETKNILIFFNTDLKHQISIDLLKFNLLSKKYGQLNKLSKCNVSSQISQKDLALLKDMDKRYSK